MFTGRELMFNAREYKFKRREHMFTGAEHKIARQKKEKLSVQKKDKPY